ncbi:MAG: thioredoxin domain-containing protein [Bacteriovoracia bacterium]
MNDKTSYNRLKNESSLYLHQHKDNPVHWWPYGPEAIQKAQDENKPIFLSIGYSSCHWCHVMAHESFDDKDTASYLNDNYICIKVDKEEHPDIDQYYQKASHVFQQPGGWPLSVFLLPNLSPFFVGTYFPKEAIQGRPSFVQVLKELKRSFEEDKEHVQKNAQEAKNIIESGEVPKEKVEFDGYFPSPHAILKALENYQDNDNGGYGDAPKFPNFPFMEWAVEQIAENIVPPEVGDHIIKTADKILCGGILDHVKGGIHRYATDNKWLIPHFEKMLYDQAGLLKVYTKLSLIYPSPLIFDAIIHTLDYLETEMQAEAGHFFSAQDADSEGVEGLYFTFTYDEFQEILVNSNDVDLNKNVEKLTEWLGIEKDGNFDHGLNVISLPYDKRQELFTPENWELIRKARKILLEARKERIPPATDNKGVASWNFMIISALCDVIQYTKIDAIRNMASKLLHSSLKNVHDTFILQNQEDKRAQIRHTTTKDETLPYFEDYVYFAESQLRVYEVTGSIIFKDNCRDTIEFIFKEFFKDHRFYTRGLSFNDIYPYGNLPVDLFDHSFRSPFAALLGLIRRFSVLEGDLDLLGKIEDTLDFAINASLQHPLAHGEALRALTYPPQIYRKIEVPRKWLQNLSFTMFLPYFSPRFILSYHEEANDNWQICNMNACEVQGAGLEEFTKFFNPPQEEDENKDDKDEKQS